MNASQRKWPGTAVALGLIVVLCAGCSGMASDSKAKSTQSAAASLSGASEVPANNSSATGTSTIRVASDKSVSGTVKVSGMSATAAHIHTGGPGVNGPVIIPLTKTADNTFSVPPNTVLTDAQYASYKTGDLYINVHSPTFPGGEVRTQLSGK